LPFWVGQDIGFLKDKRRLASVRSFAAAGGVNRAGSARDLASAWAPDLECRFDPRAPCSGNRERGAEPDWWMTPN
jgi:hypothetical protein